MPLVAQQVGGGGALISRNIGADTLVNLMVETQTLQNEAKRQFLVGTPGLALWGIAGDVSCRGGFQQDGQGFAVIGSTVYSLDLVNNAFTSLGSVANDGLPVFFASNGMGGNQIALQAGGKLYIINRLTLVLSASITLPLTNAAVSLCYFDGYFLLSEKNTPRVWWSNLNDGTTWSGIDFFARSQASDFIIGFLFLHDRLLIYGSQTSQVYYDSGDALNPFTPYPGTLTQEGAISPYAMTIMGEAAFWLSQDNQGSRRISMAQDYAPQRISTPAIEVALNGYPTVADCEVLCYEMNGHPQVRFTFPSGGDAGIAWEYDVREQLWHQCAHYDSQHSRFDRPRPRGLWATDAGLVCGDYQNACLYFLSAGTYTDNGDTIKRARRAPYISGENQWLFVDQIEQGIESGVGFDLTIPLPQLMLSLSRDSGHTWDAPIQSGAGASGDYNARAVWRRLGRVRADRLVAEVTMTDPVKAILGPGLWLRATPGSEML